MGNFPFSRFSYSNYYPYYRNYYANQNSINTETNSIDNANKIIEEPEKKEPKIAKPSHSRSFGPISFNFDNIFENNQDCPVIEILGISLYLDDLIILGLLYFLYQEGVKDEMLFLALILLLLT